MNEIVKKNRDPIVGDVIIVEDYERSNHIGVVFLVDSKDGKPTVNYKESYQIKDGPLVEINKWAWFSQIHKNLNVLLEDHPNFSIESTESGQWKIQDTNSPSSETVLFASKIEAMQCAAGKVELETVLLMNSPLDLPRQRGLDLPRQRGQSTSLSPF